MSDDQKRLVCMVADNEYETTSFEKTLRTNFHDVHLVDRRFQAGPGPSKGKGKSKDKGSVPHGCKNRTNDNRPICFAFNSPGGCASANCTFEHCCGKCFTKGIPMMNCSKCQ